MKNDLFISVSVLYPLLHAARQVGIDETQLWKECDVDPSILSSAENRFSLGQYDCLTKKAAELSRDSCFGLRLGNAFSSGSGNIVTYMIQNCSNLHEAIVKYIEYQTIVGESIKFHLATNSKEVTITFYIVDRRYDGNRYILEAEAVAMYRTGKELIASDLKLDEVHFLSPEPENPGEYAKVFQCRLKWNMPVSAIVFDKAYLEAPLKQPNRELLTLLEKEAALALKKQKGLETFSEKVARIINGLDLKDNIRIKQVARKIPISVRGLQGKLKAENTSFQTILDGIRRQMAESRLKDGSASIAEIAGSLGFSEPSVFQKAFKKWTGKSPGDFRSEP
jgi:AraC-like DNA-binding protein